MKKKLLIEISIELCALCIALFYLISGFFIKESSMKLSTNNLPPSLYPRVIGILLVVTLVYVIFSTIKQYKFISSGDEKTVKLKFVPKNVIIAIGGYVLYIAGMSIIGFLISTILFAIGILTYLQPQKWKGHILYAIIFTVGFYFVFNNILTIYLPKGILFG